MTRLLLATRNKGKLGELREIMRELPLEVVSLEDVGATVDPEENGTSFRANAVIKARAYAAATGLPVLADDSGLEVDALDGRPGICSARYAGKGASDAQRRAKLLAEMTEMADEKRTARFRCVMALVWGDELYTAEGTVEGVITREERGSGGFGYDPIFLLPDLGRTMAEIPPEQKNALSHRGQAARAMRDIIAGLIS